MLPNSNKPLRSHSVPYLLAEDDTPSQRRIVSLSNTALIDRYENSSSDARQSRRSPSIRSIASLLKNKKQKSSKGSISNIGSEIPSDTNQDLQSSYTSIPGITISAPYGQDATINEDKRIQDELTSLKSWEGSSRQHRSIPRTQLSATGYSLSIDRFRQILTRVIIKIRISRTFRELTSNNLDPMDVMLEMKQDSSLGHELSKKIGFRFDDYKISHSMGRIPSELRKILMFKRRDERTEADVDMISRYMRCAKGFSKFSTPVQRRLSEIVYYEKHEKGRYILKQDHVASNFYFIISGRVSVFKTDQDNVKGKVFRLVISELSAGDSFGEVALLKGIKRAASVVTEEESEFLRVEKEDFLQIMARASEREIEEKIEFLSQIPIIKTFSEEAIQKLCQYAAVKIFPKHSVVIQEGETSDSVFFVKKGSCRICKVFPVLKRRILVGSNHCYQYSPVPDAYTPTEGEQVIYKLLVIGEVGVGKMFGEGGILAVSQTGQALSEVFDKTWRRSMSVIASANCEVIEITKIDFLKNASDQTLEYMHQVASAQPSFDQLLNQYLDQRSWNVFKKNLIRDFYNSTDRKKKKVVF